MSVRGRTSGMIRRLPDAGAVIVVPSADAGRTILDMVLELRGPEFDKLCSVLVIKEESDLQALESSKVWISFDHTFWDMTPRAVADAARELARQCNVQLPRPKNTRLSSERGDPGFADWKELKDAGRSPRVFLDGVEQFKVLTVDSVEGSVKRCVLTADGQLIVSGDEIITEVVYGTVQIRIPAAA